MKICHYNDHEAGVVQDDRVYPIGQTLVGAGHLRQGYRMEEVINALANQPEAMQCVRQALKGRSVPLAQVQLLAPLENPGALWAAAANYTDHQAEMNADAQVGGLIAAVGSRLIESTARKLTDAVGRHATRALRQLTDAHELLREQHAHAMNQVVADVRPLQVCGRIAGVVRHR